MLSTPPSFCLQASLLRSSPEHHPAIRIITPLVTDLPSWPHLPPPALTLSPTTSSHLQGSDTPNSFQPAAFSLPFPLPEINPSPWSYLFTPHCKYLFLLETSLDIIQLQNASGDIVTIKVTDSPQPCPASPLPCHKLISKSGQKLICTTVRYFFN